MNIFKIKLGEKEKEILKHIGLSVVALSFIFMPKASEILQLFPELNPRKKKDYYQYKYKAKRIIKRLEEKDVIYLSKDKIKLTKTGKKLLKLIDSQNLMIKKPNKWNKKWSIIAYDIPNTKKAERDYFRYKLKELGFCKIQKSLWTIPYKCSQEIAVLSKIIGISPFVIYMTADHVPNEKQLIKIYF